MAVQFKSCYGRFLATAKRPECGDAFRAKVALAAPKGDRTLAELATQFEAYPNQVSTWRKELLERSAELFEDGRSLTT